MNPVTRDIYINESAICSVIYGNVYSLIVTLLTVGTDGIWTCTFFKL